MLTVLNGKKLIMTCTVVLAAYLLWAVSTSGGYIQSLPLVMVPTAHAAFLFFWMAFTASSIQRLRPGSYGKWAMRNRRYIGLSFALIHFVHAALVLSNLTFTEETRPLPTLIAGTLAYVFIGLMALTSNNWSVKKLGARSWKRLHKIGSYYIWVIFANQILNPASFKSLGSSWIPIGAVLALALRIAAYRKGKAKRPAPKAT